MHEELKAYHVENILPAAKEQRAKSVRADRRRYYNELIDLEEKAKLSGIEAVENPDSNRAGDFKVSIDYYEERIQKHGLKVVQKIPIVMGNQEMKKEYELSEEEKQRFRDKGGIYVLLIELADSNFRKDS